MQQTLKTHFALNLSAYNKFNLNRAFKGLFWLQSDSSKVVLIQQEYLNVYCSIISLRDSFWAPTSLKKSLRVKLSPFDKLCLNRAFKGLFWFRSDTRKAVLIIHEYLNIYCIIISLGTHFELQQALKSHYAQKLSPFDKLCLNRAFKGLFFYSEVTLAKLFWSKMCTHLEMQQTLKTHFALNLSAYNKFYLSRAFKGLFLFPKWL